MADSSTLQVPPPFGQGVGYGLIIGVGALFALGMSLLSWFLAKFFAEKQTSGRPLFIFLCFNYLPDCQ